VLRDVHVAAVGGSESERKRRSNPNDSGGEGERSISKLEIGERGDDDRAERRSEGDYGRIASGSVSSRADSGGDRHGSVHGIRSAVGNEDEDGSLRDGLAVDSANVEITDRASRKRTQESRLI